MKLKLVVCGVLVVACSVPAFAFSDMGDYAWEGSVEVLRDGGVVEGYGDGSFRPENAVNRAEFLKMVMVVLDLGVAEEKRCFKDLSGEEWFAGYVCRAKELGIVEGYGDGSFRGGEVVSQPEGLKMLFMALEEDLIDLGGEWYERYFNYAEWLGMYYFDVLSPEDHLLTRGEASYFLSWMVFGEVDQIGVEGFYHDRYESRIAYHTLDAAECFAGEVYDKEEQVCSLDCVEEQECLNVEKGILDRFGELLENADFGEGEDLDEELMKARYEVENENIVLIDGVGNEDYVEVWDYFKQLIPATEREMLSEYWLFSDGYGGTTAMVIQDDMDLSKWILLVDPADSHPNSELDRDELLYTLLHEFGHLVSLNVDQVDLIEEEDCVGSYFTGEGCSRVNSYINLFNEEFWSGGVEGFVSDYAATNVGEDFAESFTFFVLGDSPKGDGVADRKLKFFYGFKELVDLRNLIRGRI